MYFTCSYALVKLLLKVHSPARLYKSVRLIKEVTYKLMDREAYALKDSYLTITMYESTIALWMFTYLLNKQVCKQFTISYLQ